MGTLEQNLDLDLEDPEEILKAAFERHDFACVAAMLNAGVRLPEEGYELQQLVAGLEGDKPLDAGAAKAIARSIFKTFSQHEIDDLPFAKNAIYSLCKQGLNCEIGETTGLAAMAQALLQGSTEGNRASVDLADTVFEAVVDDLLDTPDAKHLDLFFRQLKAFDPNGGANVPLARWLVNEHFAEYEIWGEAPRADAFSKPTLSLIQAMTLILTSKLESTEDFKEALRHAFNPALEKGVVLLDLIAFSKKYWTQMEWDRFGTTTGKVIESNLTLDDLSRLAVSDKHLKTINALGFETESLNKSLFGDSVLESVLGGDLGL
ncbi:hypothetical protein RBE51_18495 [Pseudomonas taiwanensis]|uniref:hypothetical protein n=1 Tax=Pseudomonas taiwanensis TaxID=470150 RepID=UPI0028DE043C|nr:hypothetical protein [Pseudomonas taiwanensis]MDT8924786.1 hypothetical protein [Pseudomonas taiwanensis]